MHEIIRRCIMYRYISIFLIGVLALTLCGCATIFKGDDSRLYLDSEPRGARVSTEGAEICSATPCKTTLKSNQNWNITFEKDGYADKTVLLKKSVNGAWVILDVLCGLLPVIVDAATGSWNNFDQPVVFVKMEKY
jgi:hypothetical protein